jgi:hypothetical protein
MNTTSEVVADGKRQGNCTHATQVTQCTQPTQLTQCSNVNSRKNKLLEISRKIAEAKDKNAAAWVAIRFALPSRLNPLSNYEWILARGMRTVEEHHGIIGEQGLVGCFSAWFKEARPLLPQDADEDTYQMKFLEAYDKVKLPFDCDPVQAAWVRAHLIQSPAAAKIFKGKDLKMLVTLCQEMQRGEDTFYLGARSVMKLYGHKTHTTAAMWLRGLIRAKILFLVKEGGIVVDEEGKTKQLASEYQYLPQVEDNEDEIG